MKKIIVLLLILISLPIFSQRIEEKEYYPTTEYRGIFEIKDIKHSSPRCLCKDIYKISGDFIYLDNKKNKQSKKIEYFYEVEDIDKSSSEFKYLENLTIGERLETFQIIFKEEGKEIISFVSITKDRNLLSLLIE